MKKACRPVTHQDATATCKPSLNLLLLSCHYLAGAALGIGAVVPFALN